MITLTPKQEEVLLIVSEQEGRDPSQMLSLLMDNGVDFWLDGRSIDVKTCEHQFPKLVCTADEKKMGSDIYVLAHRNENKISFLGFITRRRFLEMKRVLIGEKGNPWYVTPENLYPITRLE